MRRFCRCHHALVDVSQRVGLPASVVEVTRRAAEPSGGLAVDESAEGVLTVILPKVRDPRLVTIRRGGILTDADHHRLAWAALCAEHVLDLFEVGSASGPAAPSGDRSCEGFGARRGDDDPGSCRGRARHGRSPGSAWRNTACGLCCWPGCGRRTCCRARARWPPLM